MRFDKAPVSFEARMQRKDTCRAAFAACNDLNWCFDFILLESWIERKHFFNFTYGFLMDLLIAMAWHAQSIH